MDKATPPTEAYTVPIQGPYRLPLTAFRPLKLVLQPGGLAVELTRPDMVIGRHTGVDVRLPLPDVSRRHCRFVYAQGMWQIFDLDSLNGVFVNGERVRQATLHQGDLLGIGGFRLAVELGAISSPDSPPAPPLEKDPAILAHLGEALPTLDVDPPQRKAS
jgi:predicted component of type VI protein secretion system